ncbi:MAG: hypothetical protein HY260_15660, partial [Chloroflexi bacterium]|nr:hypothetical protein [Chloroflexota bacterium]
MRNSTRVTVLFGLAAVLWLTIVLAGYYYVHKPIQPSQGLPLARLALTLIGWLATLALAAGIGRAILPFLSDLSRREAIALQMGLGLGVLGLFVLALGAVGGYRPWIAWAALIGGLIAFRRTVRSTVAELRAAVPRWPATGANRALAIFVGLTLALAFLRALAPPTAWDALVYHLTGPALYIASGGIHHSIDIPYLGFPQWPEMLFTWAMLLGSANGAALFHFTFAVLTLCLVPGLTRTHASGRGWLVWAILVAIPTAALLASWAYVEWFTMFAVTASFFAIAQWQGQEANERKWLALAGAFAGLGFAAKYTTLGAVLGLGLLVLFWAGRERFVRAALTFGLAAALVALPWLIKTLALTGNPIYPFIFAGKYWDAYRSTWYSQPGTGLRGLALLIAPWTATVWGVEGGSPYGADIGPMFLGLIPFIFLGWRERSQASRRLLIGALIVVGAAYAAWIAQLALSRLLAQTRLLLPVFPLLAVFAAIAFDNLKIVTSPRFAARWVVGASIALALALNATGQILSFAADSPLPVVVGAQSEADYLTS